MTVKNMGTVMGTDMDTATVMGAATDMVMAIKKNMDMHIKNMHMIIIIKKRRMLAKMPRGMNAS